MSRHFFTIPLTILPLVLYLVVAFTFSGAGVGQPEVWDRSFLTLHMMSGGVFTLLYEHLLLFIGLICLFFEIWKSTRQTSQEMAEQVLSMLVFIVYLVLFITVSRCAHAVFFLLMLIALIDVVGGFLVSMRTARRSLAVESDISP
jgi:hypothetical protein